MCVEGSQVVMSLCVSLSASSEEGVYVPAAGEVFDPNEESLLAELHLATSGRNVPGEGVCGCVWMWVVTEAH